VGCGEEEWKKNCELITRFEEKKEGQ